MPQDSAGPLAETVPVFPSTSPEVRRVPVDRPWAWLAAGWRDLLAAPSVSLAYGAGIVALSWLLMFLLTQTGGFWLVLPITAGFFFVAPLLAVGLYETSRRLAAGEPVSLGHAMAAYKRNSLQLSWFGALLGIIHLFWIRIALLIFALFFGINFNPTWDSLVAKMMTAESIPFWIVGWASGGILAAFTFAIGAISIPMMLDRDVNLFTAIATSFTVVTANWMPMALWAALIAGLNMMGMVPFFVGLAVTMPLVGHATWHAYRDLVLPEAAPTPAQG